MEEFRKESLSLKWANLSFGLGLGFKITICLAQFSCYDIILYGNLCGGLLFTPSKSYTWATMPPSNIVNNIKDNLKFKRIVM